MKPLLILRKNGERLDLHNQTVVFATARCYLRSLEPRHPDVVMQCAVVCSVAKAKYQPAEHFQQRKTQITAKHDGKVFRAVISFK